jgi:hypothetical protein
MKAALRMATDTGWCLWITFIYMTTIHADQPGATKFLGLFWFMHALRMLGFRMPEIIREVRQSVH